MWRVTHVYTYSFGLVLRERRKGDQKIDFFSHFGSSIVVIEGVQSYSGHITDF